MEDGLNEELDNPESQGPVRLALGINADSLASWFLSAVGPLLRDGRLLIDLRVDDQEQTHKMLKEGTVVGCVSDQPTAIQGCRVESLGEMKYRLLASPDFVAKWFPHGLTLAEIQTAPAVIFNRKDQLHYRFLTQAIGGATKLPFVHYVPAPEQFIQMIGDGYAYGMVPDWQSKAFRSSGRLVEVCETVHVGVDLYWHCWNLAAAPLQVFSAQLVREAKRLLAR